MAQGQNFFRTGGKLPKNVGILSLGGLNLGAAKADAMVKAYSWAKKRLGHFTSEGAGTLETFQATHLAAHLRVAVKTGGKNIPAYKPYGYDPYYSAWKVKNYPGKASTHYYASGQLMKNITVLNRRLAGGGRGRVAGVAQNKYVDSLTSSGKVPLDKIVLDLELGHRTGKPRMLLTHATQDFLNKHVDKANKGFFSAVMTDIDKHVAEAVNKDTSITQKDASGKEWDLSGSIMEVAASDKTNISGEGWSTSQWTKEDKKYYSKAVVTDPKLQSEWDDLLAKEGL